MDDSKVNPKTQIACLLKKRAEIDDNAHLKKYVVWENKSNICWLDASMALIAHNKVMKRASLVSPQSRISIIISSYSKAISIINKSENCSQGIDLLSVAKSILNCVQDSTLQYLSPILKYIPGDPDSAFCSMYNLIKEDQIIKGLIDATWISDKTCTNCGHHSKNTKTKPLITLSKIVSFDPKSPAVLYNCNCGKPEQMIKFTFVALPPCLIFHFENGAGHEEPPLSFTTHNREYYLTGIMTLEKGQESNVNHFISWVRDPFVDKWLDCNDLNQDIMYFTPNYPDIKFEDVSFYVYESFDDFGTIRDNKEVNINKSEENIPCIDITEEVDDLININSKSSVSGADINAKKLEGPSKESKDIISTEINSSKSQLETLSGNKEQFSDEKIMQSNLALSSETSSNVTKKEENDVNETESTKQTCLDQGVDIQNEKETINSGFQNLRVSDAKPGEGTSERVNQTDYEDSFEVCKSYDYDNTCYDQKQTEDLKINAVYEAISKAFNDKNDEHSKVLLPVKEFRISDLEDRKSKDITEAEIAKSGTSYVKLSFRRKKHPGLAFLRQKSLRNGDKVSFGAPKMISNKTSMEESKSPTSIEEIESPKSVEKTKSPESEEETKTSKRNSNELDTVPKKRHRKNQKIRQTLEGLQLNLNKEDTTSSMHEKDPKLALEGKSKIKHNVGKRPLREHKISHSISKHNKNSKGHNQVLSNQQTHSSMSSAIVNSNKKDNKVKKMHSAIENSNKDDDEVKILEEFDSVWPSHVPSCNCKLLSFEETMDTSMNYSFAYFSDVGLRPKKAGTY